MIFVLAGCCLSLPLAWQVDADRTLAVPPLVNAPVAPDTIYVGRVGPGGGLSVIDLNGFGAGTGDPTVEFPYSPATEGTSHYPFNPNVSLQGGLLTPPLALGTTGLDGGSSGAFTLARNEVLADVLFGAPSSFQLGDLMLGWPLDVVYNNGLPFGCGGGGGNVCASSGLQLFSAAFAPPHALVPAGAQPPLQTVLGGGNPISWAPHPNPPPLLSPPLCAQPEIAGQEPTSIDTSALGFVNLLGPGMFFGQTDFGIPPSGLFANEQNAFFVGPSLPQASIVSCTPYTMRQQVGHFLYAIDRTHDDLLVLNSNRMTVLARIELTDPVELAMDPDLRFIAVSEHDANVVTFIDIDPRSATFHSIVKVTGVGSGPRGIAWEPGGEDILVCNEGDDTVSILSAFSLEVRKTLSNPAFRSPFAVALTPRQDRFGFARDVYIGYILDRSGRLHLFESGPDGVNGWGADDIVATAPFRLFAPQAIQADPTRLESGVWIAHRGPLAPDGSVLEAGGALTRVALSSTVVGTLPLANANPPPQRGFALEIDLSLGSAQLTGFPQDVAFDDLSNLGALGNYHTTFSPGVPVVMNGKNLVRDVGLQGVLPTNVPKVIFVPVRRADLLDNAIDVIDLATGVRMDTNPFQAGVQSIPAPGARYVMSYFRQ